MTDEYATNNPMMTVLGGQERHNYEDHWENAAQENPTWNCHCDFSYSSNRNDKLPETKCRTQCTVVVGGYTVGGSNVAK